MGTVVGDSMPMHVHMNHLLADLRTNNRQLGKVRVKVKYRLVYNLYCGVTQISPQILKQSFTM